jgi:hypothetical protein
MFFADTETKHDSHHEFEAETMNELFHKIVSYYQTFSDTQVFTGLKGLFRECPNGGDNIEMHQVAQMAFERELFDRLEDVSVARLSKFRDEEIAEARMRGEW